MKYKIVFLVVLLFCYACGEKKIKKNIEKAGEKVRFMTLDPGHFHAALVHKTMYSQVDPTIYLYAPDGPEVKDFLNKLESYNSRDKSPTQWKIKSNLSDDYFQKMIEEKPGNVMIVSGKNSKKTDYILNAVKAGINVFSDKPMVIDPEGFRKLEEAFRIADEKGLLIYDYMTERFEITTALQKQFSLIPQVFGTLVDGSPELPAITKESVHHFSKLVSGKPLVRPPWFFDIDEEGEGIVDVTTHLVDLVQWEAFPEEIIYKTDIEMLQAKRWPTILTLDEFSKVTKLPEFPEFLHKDIVGEKLNVFCNGEMIYRIKGKHAKVSVIWNFEAPEGTGDTHYSIMRGTKSNLIIKQGPEENFEPTLYIEPKDGDDFEKNIEKALNDQIAKKYEGITLNKMTDNLWKINIPEKLKEGHEAHFGRVTQNYLEYFKQGKLPHWEVPNMITKYYTNMEALRMARTSE